MALCALTNRAEVKAFDMEYASDAADISLVVRALFDDLVLLQDALVPLGRTAAIRTFTADLPWLMAEGNYCDICKVSITVLCGNKPLSEPILWVVIVAFKKTLQRYLNRNSRNCIEKAFCKFSLNSHLGTSVRLANGRTGFFWQKNPQESRCDPSTQMAGGYNATRHYRCFSRRICPERRSVCLSDTPI